VGVEGDVLLPWQQRQAEDVTQVDELLAAAWQGRRRRLEARS
jgi:hypothetical protein